MCHLAESSTSHDVSQKQIGNMFFEGKFRRPVSDIVVDSVLFVGVVFAAPSFMGPSKRYFFHVLENPALGMGAFY